MTGFQTQGISMTNYRGLKELLEQAGMSIDYQALLLTADRGLSVAQ
jgi:hypothetical protein